MKKVLKWFKDTFGDTWLIKFIERAFFSLDNSNKGLSGKKLTAVALTYCIVQLHEYYCQYAFFHKDFSLLPMVLGADFGFLSILFGINEYGKKRGETKTDSTTTESVTTETSTETTTEQKV